MGALESCFQRVEYNPENAAPEPLEDDDGNAALTAAPSATHRVVERRRRRPTIAPGVRDREQVRNKSEYLRSLEQDYDHSANDEAGEAWELPCSLTRGVFEAPVILRTQQGALQWVNANSGALAGQVAFSNVTEIAENKLDARCLDIVTAGNDTFTFKMPTERIRLEAQQHLISLGS